MDIEPAPKPEKVPGSAIHRPGRRIVLSVASGAGNTVLVSLLGALAIRFITVQVGPENYGLYVTAMTFISTVMLFTDLGVNAITGREISKHPEGAAELLSYNMGLRLTLGLILIPILAVLALAVYGTSRPQLLWALGLFALAIPFDALRAISLGYYVSSIRNYYTAAVVLFQEVLYVGGVVIALATHSGIVGCACSSLISTAVTGCLAFVIVRREILVWPRFSMAKWRTVLTQSVTLGLIQVVNLLYLNADTLLLTKMAAPREVGYYGVAYSFVTFIMGVPSLVMTALIPLLARADQNDLPQIVRRAAHMLATLGVLAAAGTMVFAPQAITLLSRQQYLDAAAPLRILAASCILAYLNTALGFIAVARNQHHRIVYVSAGGLVLNVITNLVAIPHFGIDGAASATLITEVCTLVAIRFCFVHDVGISISLFRIAYRAVAAGALTIVIVHLGIVHSWSAPPLTLVWAPVFVVIYVVLLMMVRALPQEVTDVWRRFVKG